MTAPLHWTLCIALAAGSLVLVIVGVLGPWQTVEVGFFATGGNGVSGSGLELGTAVLGSAVVVGSLDLGYALYVYAGKREVLDWPVGALSVGAAALVAFAEVGLVVRIEENPSISVGWGAIVAGVGAAGLLAAGLWRLLNQSEDD